MTLGGHRRLCHLHAAPQGSNRKAATMYVPKHFVDEDQDAFRTLIQERGFATFVTVADGAPFATHCPLTWKPEGGPHGTLVGHIAKANPQWQHFDGKGEALAIFHGPHAYISPSWYGQHPSVPTWNYVTVHAYGVPEVLPAGEARDLLRALVDQYEAKDSDWSMDALPEGYMTGMVRGIVAFAMPITRLEAKSKLSQNRGVEDRKRVIARLEAMGGDDNTGTAKAMRRVLR
jgi:transcriptional regulator